MKHAFLDHHSGIESPIHHLDARAKVIVFFTFILVGVSSPPSAFLLLGLLAVGLVSIALYARLPLCHLLKKVVIVLPFLFFVALSIPFMKKDGVGEGYRLGFGGLSVSQSGLWIFWNVLVKASLGIFSMILLYSTTSFPKLIRGMDKLYFPKVFTVLFSFMYRYSFILVDEIQRMKRARDSRCFGGQWLWQTKTVGHMIGTLFVRSFHRGERVYLAMLSRGYNGAMPDNASAPEKFGRGEILFASLVLLLIFLRVFLG
jgi:cobalt/nickel transport system permease protein